MAKTTPLSRLATLTCGLLVAACSTETPGPPPKTNTTETTRPIRLGTWNLEHFGQRDKFQSRPGSPPNRTDAQVASIARFIREMQVDVLAIQEIGGPQPLLGLLAHLGDDYRFSVGTTGRYGETMIAVGFLWNSSRVELLQCEEMTDFPSKVEGLSVFHRKPVNAVFRVVANGTPGLDFRAIAVHLKASRGRKNERKRTTEVTILREYLARLGQSQGEDRDIVVLGDFNHTFDAPAHAAFTAGDVVRYASAKASPTIVWFDDPIDQIALTAGIRDEVIPGSFKVHNHRVDYSLASKEKLDAAKVSWRVTFSDHFPVTIDLDVSVDRDPNATFGAPVHALPARGRGQ